MRIEISDKCIRCGRCVRVCPFEILEQEKPGMPVTVQRPDRCIGCGHCVAVCPASAIDHELFPAGQSIRSTARRCRRPMRSNC